MASRRCRTQLALQSLAQEGPPVYAVVEAGVWDTVRLGIPVDRYGQLVAWVDLR
jgi:hypothetical protein